MSKVIIITGATSGIGLKIYESLVNQGCICYSISRRDSINPYHIKCDITNSKDIENAVSIITRKESKIDCLINCSGIGISGAIEFSNTNDIKKQFDVNFFGVVEFTNKFIPIFRKQGYGKIINISSLAAYCPIPFQAFYSASKSSLNTYSLALRNELKSFNIKVAFINLGDIKTNFTSNRIKSQLGDDIYKGVISKSVKKMENDEKNGMDPAKIGKAISKIVYRKHMKPKYTIGFTYKLLNILAKLLPTRLLNYIIYKLYC